MYMYVFIYAFVYLFVHLLIDLFIYIYMIQTCFGNGKNDPKMFFGISGP